MDAVLSMDDGALSSYILNYGDRLAVKTFCRQGKDLARLKKTSLLQKIQNKVNRKSDSKTGVKIMVPKCRGIGNKNAEKKNRKIELGWVNLNTKTQALQGVRSSNGGGTRHITIPKSCTMADLLIVAQNIYFENDVSPLGSISDFTTSILNFKKEPTEVNNTVEHYYDRAKMRILKFYFCTKALHTSSDEECDDLSSLLPRLNSKSSKTTSSSSNMDQDYIKCNDNCQTEEDNPSDHNIASGNTPVVTGTKEIDSTCNSGLIPENQIICSETVEIAQTSSYENNNDPWVIEENPYEDSGIVQFGPFSNDFENLDDTQLHVPETVDDTQSNTIALRIHRGNTLKDLIHYFKDPTILQKNIEIIFILSNGQEEIGRGDGVLRDCISEFFRDFYDQCCLGSDIKVPVVSNEFREDSWKAVARIVVKAWKQAKYFPIQLAPVLVEKALFWTFSSSLIENFLGYIPLADRRLLSGALHNFSEIDPDELLEFLETHNCRSLVTQDNINSVVENIAHKVLIQLPNFIIDCWAEIPEIHNLFRDYEELQSTYRNLMPNSKKVIKLLEFPKETREPERETANHLKRMIREMEAEKVQLFLRFCTGSNLMPQGTDKIKVQFINLYGLQRRPIAHTCGNVLQLPTSYENYISFRTEFNKILSSDIWVMDFV